MRFYFINRFYWPDESATAQMLGDLARHLAAQQFEVHVITSRYQLENPEIVLPAHAEQAGVTINRLSTTHFGHHRGLALRAVDFLSFYCSAFFTLLFRLRRGDVVVALTDPPLVSVIAALACFFKRAHLINWLQDLYPEVAWNLGVIHEYGLMARVLRSSRDWALRRAVQNIAIGEHMATRIHGIGAPAQIIHNWSKDLLHSPGPQADNRYRVQVGCGDSLLVCYSGNLGRAHRFEALIKASAALMTERQHHMLIIGGGPQFQRIKSAASSQGLSHWTFLPYQSRDQLSESLGAADVHVVSLDSSLEGLIVPSKLYGVLAAGRACIFLGHENGEVANILRQHDCGWVVDPDDVEGLTELLRLLADEREMLLQKGRNARRAFEREYAPHLAFLQWQRLLEPWRQKARC